MSPRALTHRAEQVASKLPPLLVEAERVAQTVVQGVHGRSRSGHGDSFWQFRPYQPGESTRAIDWRQSAKTQNYYVREHEWEAAQTVWLWCDGSKSMNYSSDKKNRPKKIRRAEILTLALASLLVRGTERIGLLGDSNPPGGGRAALQRLSTVFERKLHRAENFSLPQHEHLPRYTEMVLIGDFLSPLDEIEPALKRYSRRHVRGHLLQILDPAEETLPFEGRVEFKGMEKEGKAYFGNVAAIRKEYQQRLNLRRKALSSLSHALGWSFHLHRTDHPAETALMALYQSISRNWDIGS